MAWKPYTGPVVDLEQPHFHAWILGEHTFTYYDGQPMTAQFYSPILAPFHNRMTARNHGRFAANPALGAAGVMVLKCDANPATCPTWTDHNAKEREGLGEAIRGYRGG